MTLKTETNTRTMERRVLRAFRAWSASRGQGARPRIAADFEHGQWWVTNLTTGAQWSVVDAEPTSDGFDFEQVTQGDAE